MRELAILTGILAFGLLTMAVYGLSGAWRRPDPLASSAHGKFVLGSFVTGWFYWFAHPAIRLALALRLGPTFFNLAGVAFGCAAGVFFSMGRVTLGGWCVLLGGIMDTLDGRLARALGVADARGAFLDSALDRFAEVGAFVGLVVLFRESAYAVAVVSVALGGSLLVSYARARGESQGIVCKVGVMQRAERLLLVGFGALFDPAVSTTWGTGEPGTLLLPVLTLVAVGTVGTAAYRTVWIARALRGQAS